MRNLPIANDDLRSKCRSSDIMADAAYVVLTKDSKYTGNFLLDEDVLRDEAGITNFEKYRASAHSKL